MKKRLLALYYRPPILGLPQNSYGQYHILKAIEEIFEVKILSFRPPINDDFDSNYLIPQYSKVRKLLNLIFKFESPHLTHYFTQQMMQLYIDTLEKFKPDLIYVDNVVMMQYPLKYNPTNSKIWLFDDDSKLFNKQRRLQSSFFEKIRNYGMDKFELKSVKKSDKTFCITDEETSFLKSMGFQNIYTLPYPIDESIYYYNWDPPKNLFNVLFVGDFSHPPNKEAAKIITKIFYPIFERNQINVTIVGRNISRIQKYLNGCDNIKIFENVKDVREFYWKSNLFIAPIISGAGMRIKILEAAACGVPIVMTNIANLGINLSKEYAFIDNSTREMMSTILKIKNGSIEGLDQLSRRSSQKVINTFGLDKMINNYVKYFQML